MSAKAWEAAEETAKIEMDKLARRLKKEHPRLNYAQILAAIMSASGGMLKRLDKRNAR